MKSVGLKNFKKPVVHKNVETVVFHSEIKGICADSPWAFCLKKSVFMILIKASLMYISRVCP